MICSNYKWSIDDRCFFPVTCDGPFELLFTVFVIIVLVFEDLNQMSVVGSDTLDDNVTPFLFSAASQNHSAPL